MTDLTLEQSWHEIVKMCKPKTTKQRQAINNVEKIVKDKIQAHNMLKSIIISEKKIKKRSKF